jgi:argininosuccinate lyase
MRPRAGSSPLRAFPKCTPAFGYARLDDEASTGSSLMPQKRNPDPFELVRGNAARVTGALGGALGTVTGIALSYHRDLQETKSLVIRGTERALATLDAFERAFGYVRFNAAGMEARANEGYVVATDLADALIVRGVSARTAHAAIGNAVARADAQGRPLDTADLAAIAAEAGLAETLDAPLDARASIRAKRTHGSTHPDEVRAAIEGLERELDTP